LTVPPDRLTALDAAFLDLETARAPLHVGWTLRFTGEPPSLAALRRHVASRLDRMPRFRRRVVQPALSLGDPHWADDAGFDIARHVHGVALRAPGGAAELRELAGVLLSTPLDARRPLWRLNLIGGVDGGFALVGQAHHALVDGLAAVEIATLLLDVRGAGGHSARAGWVPQGAPSPAGALGAALRGRVAAPPSVGAALKAGPAVPADLARGLARGAGSAPQALSAVAALAAPSSRTALERSVTRERGVAFASAPLDGLRASARRHGATLNDLLLAASTISVAAALRRRGELPSSVRALMPASTRGASEDASTAGNRISFLALDLPVAEPDLTRVLRVVRARAAARKRSGEAGAADALLRAADALPSAGRRHVARAAARAARFGVIVSNVPGPPVTLELLGRPLAEAWPAVPLLDGHALTIGALSYDGRLFAGVYADAEVVPDAAEIAADLQGALEALLALQKPAATPWRARARTRRDAVRAVRSAS
jgi:WS/DGAT/MGAT family acyltransferase